MIGCPGRLDPATASLSLACPPCLQGPIPASWARLPLLALLNLASNVGVCGGQPRWGAATQVRANDTNLGQSCFMVRTSGAVAGAVLGE